MKGLLIQHDCYSFGGVIREQLEQRGVIFDEFLVVEDFTNPVSYKPFPDPGDYDLVVAMGSPWSFYDDDLIGTWIGREVEFVKKADEVGVPFFGICFGAQVLAAALGGSVQLAPVSELGWYQVMTAEPEAVAEGPWMQWHKDGFTPPAEAEILAKSPAGVQAMRIRNHFGVQFHPEMTNSIVESWIRMGGDHELKKNGVAPEDLIAATATSSEVSRPNALRLADYFLDECAKLGQVAGA